MQAAAGLSKAIALGADGAHVRGLLAESAQAARQARAEKAMQAAARNILDTCTVELVHRAMSFFTPLPSGQRRMEALITGHVQDGELVIVASAVRVGSEWTPADFAAAARLRAERQAARVDGRVA